MIVDIQNLDKYFGRFKALDNLNMNVPENAIYGFLGKNGAGKTTTLKVISALLRSSSGSCFVFGKDINQYRKEIISKCGATIETPGFYSNLTARENLRLLQKLCGVEDDKKINELLELVELGGEKKVFGSYSMGMKQRLGIAAALLNNPVLLLLDEPANGLDPSGIIKMRELLKSLNAEKKITVLVSSHILSEVEQIATHIGIIDKGKMIVEGRIEDILKHQTDTCVLEVSDIQSALSLLKELGLETALNSSMQIEINCTKETGNAVLRKLLDNNVEIFYFGFKTNLEDYFLELVGENQK